MNILRVSILCLICLAVSFAAQAGNQQSKPARAAPAKSAEMKTATVTADTPTNLQARPDQNAPGSISAAPGTVLTLCCGTVDPHDMTGSNCAYMHTGQACAGSILACPEGSKDTVTEDGSGYCKSGG